MGQVLKPAVVIKGTKDGLHFLLDDSRPFPAILEEIKYKLEQSANLWNGPDMHVMLKLGRRQITKEEEIELRSLFAIRKNLIIRSIEAIGRPYLLEPGAGLHILTGTVRSGQLLQHHGDVMLLGDVNPGGSIKAEGSIYVMGALRGLAHAGTIGDGTSIIAASQLRPTQLRIADVISRPPDQWEDTETGMHFAHLQDQQIAVDKMPQLARLRPDWEWKESRYRQL
ncbi:septum site-determining protein MinC [Mechercharimyces sp. CAU 1602]|uniref:septum site-determining protein MinC n=1 Tax=Mechercharimyces sp. CAU 1602 TaxID=2973933 RepID=UPI002161E115|nr:septum site-determining protein MinC [Mechercharimyces sp. CAU 1602]MCS1351434.1 septum site-determining protein MinC [Mechercharimyces sp. CAU 1602]